MSISNTELKSIFCWNLPMLSEVQGHLARVCNFLASLGHTVLDQAGLSNQWPRVCGEGTCTEGTLRQNII